MYGAYKIEARGAGRIFSASPAGYFTVAERYPLPGTLRN